MATTNYKTGDWIERKGKNSGLWFDGEISEINGDTITIKIWGWMDEPEDADIERLRPISDNNFISIRKGGSVWATVDEDLTIRVNGSIVGNIDYNDGTIRKNGSIVGAIYFNGVIEKNGSGVGAIWPSNELYRNGSIIGEINNQDGTIRLGGSIWGQIDDFNHKFRELRIVSAVLAFFAPEFGY